MLFGALGDIHGDFAAARDVMARHPDVPFWVCIGDIADDHGRYEPLDKPLYWIKGNNDNFDLIAARALPENFHDIPNGTFVDIPVASHHVRVAGLGGTFAPTWYETAPAALPPGRLSLRNAGGAEGATPPLRKDDKRRHFVREEVAACSAMRDVDLLLTHEAARPFRVGRVDAGKTPINEVLAAMKPRLHLFGHHHRFSEQERQGVRSVGLDLVSRSYLLIDTKSMGYHVHQT